MAESRKSSFLEGNPLSCGITGASGRWEKPRGWESPPAQPKSIPALCPSVIFQLNGRTENFWRRNFILTEGKRAPGLWRRGSCWEGGAGSEQPAPAVDGPAAAQQLLPLHAANLVVVIPGQLRASSDPPGKEKTPHRMGEEGAPGKRRKDGMGVRQPESSLMNLCCED